MKITICQLNPTIGDFEWNIAKMEKALRQAKKNNSDLAVFPELFLTGYPPRDLLEKQGFIKRTEKALKKVEKLSKKYSKIGILFGSPTPTGAKVGNKLYNSAVLVFQGKIIFTQHKSCLPRHDVFDEPRYFNPAKTIEVFSFKGEKLGVSICADIWTGLRWLEKDYFVSPIKELAKKGAEIFINLSASPFYIGKDKLRFRIVRDQALKYQAPFIYVNLVGGNDELIFDGRSMVFNQEGKLTNILPHFEEHIQTINTKKLTGPTIFTAQNKIESVYQALIFGLKDYFRKCGFKKAVIGLSGGIDSSVTCALARQALGAKNVLGLSMPSPYSSKGSIEDSKELAKNLKIDFKIIPISPIYSAYLDSLKAYIGDHKISVAEENIQARIRGNILMALSNRFGYIVLSTGNKSELAVGYCTLYGDMTGGLAVISDVPKMMVYKLANYINRNQEIIPRAIIKKPPSAELKPDQKDEDSLPPYRILDPILELYIDKKYSAKEIISKGFNPKIVKWVVHKVDKNEFKRRQAAPGLKITGKAFGMGRRMPIAARYEI